MSILWYCIEILVNMVEFGLFLYLLNSKFPPKPKSFLLFLIALLVGTTGLSCIGLFQITWMPDYIFEIGIALLYAVTALRGNIWLKMFWVVIGAALISVTAFMGISIGMQIPGVNMEVILHRQSGVRLQLLILCKVLQAILFFILAKRKEFLRLNSFSVMILLIFIPLTSLIMDVLLIENGTHSSSPENQMMLIVASLFILLIDIVVFILYEMLSKQAENNLRMQVALQQKDLLMRHSEETASLYKEMKGWRHDFHNHLQVILGYMQMNRLDKLEEYIGKIENSVNDQYMPIDSGNPLIDALVGAKMLLAERQNVQTEINIQVPPEFGVTDTDICILLGNLLDNAIEACRRIADGRARFINVEIYSVKGNLLMKLCNSADGDLKKSDRTFLTSKTGKYHGIGLRRIEEIVSKNNGYIKYGYEDGIFRTDIRLPLND